MEILAYKEWLDFNTMNFLFLWKLVYDKTMMPPDFIYVPRFQAEQAKELLGGHYLGELDIKLSPAIDKKLDWGLGNKWLFLKSICDKDTYEEEFDDNGLPLKPFFDSFKGKP